MGDYRTARFHRICDRLQDHKLTCSDMHRDEHPIVKARKCALAWRKFSHGKTFDVAYASNLLPNGTGILGQGSHALYLCFDPPLIDGERWSFWGDV